MYRIEDEIMAIREIQTYLFYINDAHPERIKTPIDGIYTEQTELAVKEFQLGNGLNPTGQVDNETFDKLYKEYLAINERRAIEESIYFPHTDLSLGDTGEEVLIINHTLLSLRKFYKDVPLVREERFFSRATEDAVKFMQSVFGIDADGVVSLDTYAKTIDENRRCKRLSAKS